VKTLLKYIFSKVSKKLKIGSYIRSGKNFSGKTCVFHRGGGNRRAYRTVDLYRRLNLFGSICGLQYDPSRTAYIGLILYDNGLFSYIILAENIKKGFKLFSGSGLDNTVVFKGSSLSVSNIPLFTVVNNIEVRPFYGATLARAAGLGAVLVARLNNVVTLKLKSGWLVKISANSVASVGYVSNMLHNMKIIAKAGKNRALGKRPVVRGVAMNPCDHPHGGGNGKTSPPTVPLTP